MVVGAAASETGIAAVVLVILLFESTVAADDGDVGVLLSLVEALHPVIEAGESLLVELYNIIAYIVLFV